MNLKSTLTLITLIISTSAKIILNDVKIESDPKYVDVKYDVKTVSEKILITLDYDLHIDLDNNAYVSVLVSNKMDGAFTPLIRLEPVPFCKYLGAEKQPPFLSLALMMLKSFAEMPEDCPIKKGRYMVKEYALDANVLIPMMPSGEFDVDIFLFVKEGDEMKQMMKSTAKVTLEQPE